MCGIPGGTLSAYVKGSITIPGPRVQQIEDAISSLENLAKHAEPLALNFSNVNMVRDCIQKLKQGRLRVVVFMADAPVKEKAFAIQFRNGQFYRGRDAKNGITRTENLMQSPAMTQAVADQLIQILSDAGFADCRAVENRLEQEDGPSAELSQVW
jgi:hypothetical protein